MKHSSFEQTFYKHRKLVLEHLNEEDPAAPAAAATSSVDAEPEEFKKLMGTQNYEQFVNLLGSGVKDPKIIAAIKAGDKNIDKVKISEISPLVKSLHPTQNGVFFIDSLQYPLTNMSTLELYLRGEVVAVANKKIVTGGNGTFIIDGHHRWSQLYIINPTAAIISIDVGIPDAEKALKVAQLAIVATTDTLEFAPEGDKTNLFTCEQKLFNEKCKSITGDGSQVVQVYRKFYPNFDALKTKARINNDMDYIIYMLWTNVLDMRKTSKPISPSAPRIIMPQTPKATKSMTDKLATGEVNISTSTVDLKKESLFEQTFKKHLGLVMLSVLKENSIESLAKISDEALDNAYHYGRSTPGNNFGWLANVESAKAAKKLIDAGETDIEKIAYAIHDGWNITAKADAAGQLKLDSPTPEEKKAKRLALANKSYDQLPEEEKEKDRVVARALLSALKK